MGSSPQGLESCLQQARLAIFLTKHAFPEERLSGSRLYEAFLPASKSISRNMNELAAFNEQVWGENGLNTARKAGQKLKEGKFSDLLAFYSYIAKERQKYERQKSLESKEPYEEFGCLRKNKCTSTTLLSERKNSRYYDQCKYIFELLNIFFPHAEKSYEYLDEGPCIDEHPTEVTYFTIKGIVRQSKNQGAYLSEPHPDKYYNSLIDATSPNEHGDYEREFTTLKVWNDLWKKISLEHPALYNNGIYEFFNVLESQFSDLIDLNNREKSIDALAEIFWTLAHAMPTKRGNASILERLCRCAQLIHDDTYLPQYRLPINLDLLAIVIPSAEQFKEIFRALFYDKNLLELVDKNIETINNYFQSFEPHTELYELREQLEKSQARLKQSLTSKGKMEHLNKGVYTALYSQKDEVAVEQIGHEKEMRPTIITLPELQQYFTSQLEEIITKEQDLRNRGHEIAADQALDLYNTIKNQSADLNEEKIDIQTFKKNWTDTISTARTKLEKHRGWKQVLDNLALAVVGLINKAGTRNFLFFKTDSANKLDKLDKAIESMLAQKITDHVPL